MLDEGRMLLVKHGAAVHGEDFLVAPGGGVEGDEGVMEAAVREVKEETGLDVDVDKILFIEDMISNRKRVLKTWFLCRVIGGKLEMTENAVAEGIVESGWYYKEELDGEVVHPEILLAADWDTFLRDDWKTVYIENIDPDADF